jgi:hypothetical protein
LVLLIGVNTYKVEFRYRDETTESTVFNAIAKHGVSVYINDPSLLSSAKALTEWERMALEWVRRAHPPLYYVFPALLAKGPQSIPYYRAIFASTFCLWLWAVVLWCLRLNLSRAFLYSLTFVPFFYQFLRDQTFIRLGDEFFTFIGFTTFMLLLYLIYDKKIKISFITILFLCFSLFISFWSKFTTVVTFLSLILAMSLIIMLQKVSSKFRETLLGFKGGLFLKILLLTSTMFLLVVGLYLWAFHNTFMLKQQGEFYTNLIYRPLSFIPVSLTHVKSEAYIPKSEFFLSAIFRYGPFVILGVIYSLYQLWRQLKLSRKIFSFDCLILIWLAIGFCAVLCIEPSPEYTIPLTFGLIYLIARGLELADNDSLTRQYFLVGFLFACTEVVLKAFVLS